MVTLLLEQGNPNKLTQHKMKVTLYGKKRNSYIHILTCTFYQACFSLYPLWPRLLKSDVDFSWEWSLDHPPRPRRNLKSFSSWLLMDRWTSIQYLCNCLYSQVTYVSCGVKTSKQQKGASLSIPYGLFNLFLMLVQPLSHAKNHIYLSIKKKPQRLYWHEFEPINPTSKVCWVYYLATPSGPK